MVNIIIRPSVFTRYQRVILDSPVMMVFGELQDEHGAVAVMAHTCQPATSDALSAPPRRIGRSPNPRFGTFATHDAPTPYQIALPCDDVPQFRRHHTSMLVRQTPRSS